MIFCPDPNNQNNLIQLTAPSDTRQVPTTDPVALKSMIDGLKLVPHPTKYFATSSIGF